MDTVHLQALAAYEQQDYERAIELLRVAAARIEDAEERARLLVKCAIAQDVLGHHTEALETLRQTLELHPESTAGWNTLGIVCQHIGKLDEARAAFERAYALNPAQADPLVNLGAVCLRQGDPGNALQYLQLALEMLPGHPAVHANLALTYAVFGRLEDAEDALRLAVLYGFDQAEAIEERLAGLKAVREKILSGAGRDDETGQIPPDPGSPDRG